MINPKLICHIMIDNQMMKIRKTTKSESIYLREQVNILKQTTVLVLITIFIAFLIIAFAGVIIINIGNIILGIILNAIPVIGSVILIKLSNHSQKYVGEFEGDVFKVKGRFRQELKGSARNGDLRIYNYIDNVKVLFPDFWEKKLNYGDMIEVEYAYCKLNNYVLTITDGPSIDKDYVHGRGSLKNRFPHVFTAISSIFFGLVLIFILVDFTENSLNSYFDYYKFTHKSPENYHNIEQFLTTFDSSDINRKVNLSECFLIPTKYSCYFLILNSIQVDSLKEQSFIGELFGFNNDRGMVDSLIEEEEFWDNIEKRLFSSGMIPVYHSWKGKPDYIKIDSIKADRYHIKPLTLNDCNIKLENEKYIVLSNYYEHAGKRSYFLFYLEAVLGVILLIFSINSYRIMQHNNRIYKNIEDAYEQALKNSKNHE